MRPKVVAARKTFKETKLNDTRSLWIYLVDYLSREILSRCHCIQDHKTTTKTTRIGVICSLTEVRLLPHLSRISYGTSYSGWRMGLIRPLY
jgi:hypothetical protein